MTQTKLTFFAVCFLNFQLTIAQTPSIIWQKTFGGTKSDKTESIIQTNSGDIILAGESASTDIDLSDNKGGYDAFVFKFTKQGQVIWKKSFGGTGDDLIHAAIELSDGSIICVGESFSNTPPFNNLGNSDMFACRISSDGTLVWLKNYGGNGNDFGFSLALHPDGNIMLAGHSETQFPNSLGMMDMILYKIDVSGNIIWQKSYGGSKQDYVKRILACSQGFLLVGNSSSNDHDIPSNLGGQDICVLLLDWTGKMIWAKNFGGSNHEHPEDVIEDTDKNIIVTGDTFSTDYDATENHRVLETRDYLLIKISPSGQKIYSRCYGGEHNEYPKGMVQLYSGDYCILGESYSISGQPTNNHGSADFWLIKTDKTTGDLLWQKNYGGQSHDEPSGMLINFGNTLYVVGNVSHPARNGDIAQTFGEEDIWIIQLKMNECEQNLILREKISYGNNEYQASEHIQLQSKIEADAPKTILNAGKSIELLPGFNTQAGNVFETKLMGCQ